MSSPLDDPYRPPRMEPKLTDAQAADVKQRDIAMFVLLMIVTLGIYWFYLAFQWAKEINGLEGRAKYRPLLVLLISIVTCGIGGIVFECLYAFDVANAARSRGIPSRNDQLGIWIVVLNCVALAASATTVGAAIGLPLGILASALLQSELNKLAIV